MGRAPAYAGGYKGGPLRIGVVSGFFREHAVWKMHLRYWMEGFDRRRFRLYGYHTGMQQDDITTLARAGFDKFVDYLPVGRMSEQIRADNLHVLIHSEVFDLAQAACCTLSDMVFPELLPA
jgi:predicted O-linked N-acetylglucosamine transferase (SPINDLY family)